MTPRGTQLPESRKPRPPAAPDELAREVQVSARSNGPMNAEKRAKIEEQRKRYLDDTEYELDLTNPEDAEQIMIEQVRRRGKGLS